MLHRGHCSDGRVVQRDVVEPELVYNGGIDE
jgi:hypothetical protein